MADFNKFIKGFEEPKEEQPKKESFELHFENDDDEARLPQFHKYEDRETALKKAAEFGEKGQNAYVKVRGADGKLHDLEEAPKAEQKHDFSGLDDYEINTSIAAYEKEGVPENEKAKYDALLKEKEARFQKAKAEQEKPKAKYQGGFAKDLQEAGFDPYEVDEEKQVLKVKGANGSDYQISQGAGYSYNVFKDGKQIYKNVPNYMPFETVVAGKPDADFKRYEMQAPQQPKQGSFNEVFGKENKAPELPKNFLDDPASNAYDYFGKKFEKAEWGKNAYKTKDGEEWWLGTEEEAYQAAKDDINDFIQDQGIFGFTENFRNWIIQNAIDDNFMNGLKEEEADYYESEGEKGQADAIRSMDNTEFAEYLKMNIGEREFAEIINKNKAYDLDKIADEAISWDGIAHFLSSYNGKEYELPNGFLAYRLN